MNINALNGLTIKIRNAPTAHPINAPKTGTNAVNAITIPVNSAYGSLNSVIVITNIAPRIKASTHCPVKKPENVLYVKASTSNTASALPFLTNANNTFFACLPSFSFCSKI